MEGFIDSGQFYWYETAAYCIGNLPLLWLIGGLLMLFGRRSDVGCVYAIAFCFIFMVSSEVHSRAAACSRQNKNEAASFERAISIQRFYHIDP
jgi:hypothetical protein